MSSALMQISPFSSASFQQPTAQAANAPTLQSTNLLRGQKVVQIMHNGAVYKLQATKLGKLILTK
jgi:hemin uptake protein HemP